MPDNKTLRVIISFVTSVLVIYAGGYLLLTHYARIAYGSYENVAETVSIPTWGRVWDLTPVIALAVVGLLWGYLMGRDES